MLPDIPNIQAVTIHTQQMGEYTVTIKGPTATAFSFRGTRNSDLQYTNPCPAKSILKNTIDISCVTSLENAFSGMKSLESIECDLFESCKGRVTTCAIFLINVQICIPFIMDCLKALINALISL